MEEITIEVNGQKFYAYSINGAIATLKKLDKNKFIITQPPRCPKCVWEGTCNNFDIDGNCVNYKRDPPDGGYYG